MDCSGESKECGGGGGGAALWSETRVKGQLQCFWWGLKQDSFTLTALTSMKCVPGDVQMELEIENME